MKPMPSCKGITVMTPDQLDSKIVDEILDEVFMLMDVDKDAAVEVLAKLAPPRPPKIRTSLLPATQYPLGAHDAPTELAGDHLI